jgi:thymidylate kinase
MSVTVSVICGNIGAGKSTVMDTIASSVSGSKNNITVVKEPINIWYPMIKDVADAETPRKKEEAAARLQTEVMNHYERVGRMVTKKEKKMAALSKGPGGEKDYTHHYFVERGPMDVEHVFTPNLRDSGAIGAECAALLNTRARSISMEAPWYRAVVFFLDSSAHVCYKRYAKRDDGHYPLTESYIAALDARYRGMEENMRSAAMGPWFRGKIITVNNDTSTSLSETVDTIMKAVGVAL